MLKSTESCLSCAIPFTIWIVFGLISGHACHWAAGFWVNHFNPVHAPLPELPFDLACMLIGPANSLTWIFVLITWVYSFC